MATGSPSRYAATYSLSFGGTTYDAAAMPVMKAQSRPAVNVTAGSDNVSQFIAGALTTMDEFTVTLFQTATPISTDDTPAALTFTVSLDNGLGNPVSANVSYPRAIVTKVSPPSLAADGDRKATYDVTFQPDGTASAS